MFNKVLKLNDFYFILPDDFNGKFSDALFLLAEYMKSREEMNNLNFGKLDISNQEWIEQNHDDIHKHCGDYGLCQYDKENDKYIIIG